MPDAGPPASKTNQEEAEARERRQPLDGPRRAQCVVEAEYGLRREVVDRRERDHESEEHSKPRPVNRQGELRGLHSSVSRAVDDFERLRRPEAERRLEDKEARKKTRAARDRE